ncbi:hypothetical protein PsorP6_011262 [Peronosclerospora sorghi]|uniref:Uncharacterized protein n=1 Tax=Peronosclerospora sorghi TaxID=230839 RepID=A0ACC0WIR2_9STRA|nr:hypothetical protein PsorP6_011262 [Peronosclerospora sorghi]
MLARSHEGPKQEQETEASEREEKGCSPGAIRDERVIALSLPTIWSAVARCVSVYRGLLPENCRSLANESTTCPTFPQR